MSLLPLLMLVSSRTLVLHRTCALALTAFFLLRDPVAVYSSVPVVVLGQGLGLPHVYKGQSDSLLLMLALLLVVQAAEELTSLFASDYLARLHLVVPVRLVIFFGLTAGCYLHALPLANSLVFAYGFLELVLNFWLWLCVREEHNELYKQDIRARYQTDEPPAAL